MNPEPSAFEWGKGRFRLFLSHKWEDRVRVTEIQSSLADYGVACFVAHRDIEVAGLWREVMEVALSSCHGLVAFLSGQFHESVWTDQEVGWALGRRIPIVPVCLDETMPYGFLGKLQALRVADLTPGEVAATVFAALRRSDVETNVRLDRAVVHLVTESRTFAEAKSRGRLLEGIKFWTHSVDARLRFALQTNSQVSGEFTVPGKIAQLSAEHARRRTDDPNYDEALREIEVREQAEGPAAPWWESWAAPVIWCSEPQVEIEYSGEMQLSTQVRMFGRLPDKLDIKVGGMLNVDPGDTSLEPVPRAFDVYQQWTPDAAKGNEVDMMDLSLTFQFDWSGAERIVTKRWALWRGRDGDWVVWTEHPTEYS